MKNVIIMAKKNIWSNFIQKRFGYQTKNIDETYKWYLGSDEKIYEEVLTNLLINRFLINVENVQGRVQKLK